MKMLTLPKKSAKQFLLELCPQVLELFDVPQNILGFNVPNTIRKQVYAMSEETAQAKLNGLKELLKKW